MTDKLKQTMEPSEIDEAKLDEVSGGPVYVKITEKTGTQTSGITDGTSNTILVSEIVTR